MSSKRRPLLTVAGLVLAGLALVWSGATSPSLLARAQESGPALAELKPMTPTASCAALAKADIGAAIGESLAISTAEEQATAKGPFCHVRGTIQPAIQFEVFLPIKAWTGRYLQTGCGGLCGNLNVQVSHAGTCLPAAEGDLVVASDDMGHQGGSADFGADPQKRIDFAYRGNHVTALAAKALIKAFYGQSPRYSYFSGCSDGGREALVEAERYPEDFDGIAAGAPAMNFQTQNSFYHAWQARSNTGPDGKAILIASRLPILHRAAVAACDAQDGLKDGLISDPLHCKFDPATAQCRTGAADTSDCLTAQEVGAARKLYAGPTDAEGHRFTIGGPQPGSELAWAGVYVPTAPDGQMFSRAIASGAMGYVIFPQVSKADGDIDHFDFSQANFARLAALHPLYDSTDTNLERFRARGGKLILWHGWSDQHISPINTIAYFDGVKQTLGEQKAAGFLRLFLFPGMYHCGGGDGFSQFDILSPLMGWVEKGRAPDRIMAAEASEAPRGQGPRSTPIAGPDQPPVRTRPIFAYPQVARYSGSGDPNSASSFVAAQGAPVDPAVFRWQGSGNYAPDVLRSYAAENGKLTEQPARKN